MTHPRKLFRDALRIALSEDADMAGVKVCRSWSFPENEEELPAFTVGTPIETVGQSTGDQVDRTTQIAVAMKLAGGDALEDDMDDYSEVIERVGVEVFQSWASDLPNYQVTRIATDIQPGARHRIGTLEVVFSVLRFAPEGAQS